MPDEVLARRIENAPRYMGRLVREGVLTGRAVNCALTAAGLPPLPERQRPIRPQNRVRAQTLFALAGTAVSAYA